MNKKQHYKYLILAVALSLLVNLFFGRFLAARLSTMPLLNKWNILSPQAPIVINTREEIRVNDGKDILEAISSVKSKLSLVLLNQSGQMSVAGYALNLASEGLFSAPQAVFAQKGEYYIVLSDGRRALVKQRTFDPATRLAFFSADLNSVPVVSWGESRQLKPGEKIIAVNSSLQASVPQAKVLFVSRMQADIALQSFQADYPRRSFALQSPEGLALGTPLINTQGEAVGIVAENSGVLSSDVMKKALDIYISDRSKISRARFGFAYAQQAKLFSQLGGQPEGALVTAVDRSGKTRSPAAEAGLLEKDLVTAVDGQALSESLHLEELLQKYKPGDKVKLEIFRGKEVRSLTLNLKALEE